MWLTHEERVPAPKWDTPKTINVCWCVAGAQCMISQRKTILLSMWQTFYVFHTLPVLRGLSIGHRQVACEWCTVKQSLRMINTRFHECSPAVKMEECWSLWEPFCIFKPLVLHRLLSITTVHQCFTQRSSSA